MATEEKYDVALLGILQHEGKIERFLNVVLGFLYHRTDFYRLMKDKHDKLGFPPGVALKMMTAIFQQYDALTRRDDEARLAEQKKKNDDVVTKGTAVESNFECPSAVKTESATPGSSETDKVKPTMTDSVQDTSEQKMDVETNQDKAIASDVSDKTTSSDSVTAGKSDSAMNSEKAGDAPEKKSGEQEKEDEDPELTKQQKMFQANPDSYNGAVRDNYTWAQSITDVDLKVNVPACVKKGRDCKVEISRRHVKVAHRDEGGGWTTKMDGDLTWDVDKEESMWSLNPGQNIHINFEKKEERWWEAVLTDEPKISVRKIDASRPMTDLDDEAQAKIEEMMYNDRQKKLGKPQSHEQKMFDTLKTAWDAEGSPFKGQPFDPSKLNVDPSGVVNFKS